MAFVVVRCHDITKLKRFLEAVSFSAASTSLLPQLPFQHVLLSISESSYLLVPDSLSSDLLRLLPAAQNQIIMKVIGLDASIMSVSMNNGKIEDDFSTGEMIENGVLLLLFTCDEIFLLSELNSM
jgi:hypothetical protein